MWVVHALPNSNSTQRYPSVHVWDSKLIQHFRHTLVQQENPTLGNLGAATRVFHREPRDVCRAGLVIVMHVIQHNWSWHVVLPGRLGKVAFAHGSNVFAVACEGLGFRGGRGLWIRTFMLDLLLLNKRPRGSLVISCLNHRH